MATQVLYKLAGMPADESAINPFGDVAAGKWYTDSVIWAYNSKIAAGTGSATFGPDELISRADMAVLLLRWAGYNGTKLASDRTYSGFADEMLIPEYARFAVKLMYGSGIISGKPGNLFDPVSGTTRAEAATMFYALGTKTQKQEQPLLAEYGVRAALDAYVNMMPSTEPGTPISGFVCVTFEDTSIPAGLPDELVVTARITGDGGYADITLEKTTGGRYRCALSDGDIGAVGFASGKTVCVDVTFTIGEDTQTTTFYPMITEAH